MPLRRVLAALALLAWSLVVVAAHAVGETPPAPRRIVSLNLCTDQLVLALADRDAVRSVTWLARDPQSAVMAAALVADEPIAALDPYHQLQVMEVLRETARQGTLVVVVLHDLTLAARFCDRLVLLDAGHVVADGAPDVVLSAANLTCVYRVTVVRDTHDGALYVVPWSRHPGP